MRDRDRHIIYRYLVVTLILFCIGVTFLIYGNSGNKNFIQNPIDTDKAWYQFFTDGIKNISSSTLEWNIETMNDNIQKWVNLLEVAKLKNINKVTEDIINKNLTIGKNINQITQTLYCVQYVKNISLLYLQLIEKYNILSQKFIALNKAISDKLTTWLLDEDVKLCYLDYIQNIKFISDDLVWWYKQITQTKWYIDEMVQQDYEYQYCQNIQNKHDELQTLSSELSWYINTIDLVINRVNSDKIEDNKTLCNFWTIIGMTGIESKIYKINNTIKWETWDNTIDDVQNYDQYIEKVKDKTEQYLDKLNQLFKK